MNKQGPKGIGWCDWTWNPCSGCWGPGGTAEKPNRCSYCYALRVANRFRSAANPWFDPFAPTFHPERLSEPATVKKPSKIFCCSMADLFGDWVLQEWIEAVLNRCTRTDYSHHTFQFLTKNPKRLKDFNPWPSNCWVGTTVCDQADADERLPWLLQVNAPVRFVSHEPLLSGIDLSKWVRPDEIVPDSNSTGWGRNYCGISWAIIGAMTGPGAVKVDPAWVVALEAQYQAAGVPVFEKDSLQSLCGPGAQLLREFPA